jgi:isoquinoline 1-oxidoreductase beta subunit
VVWSREDDIRHDYYHAVSAQLLKAGLDENGAVSGWLHRAAYPSIMTTFDAAVSGPVVFELGLGALNMPYDIPNVRLESLDTAAKVRIGWLRSVCNIFHAFAVNAFSDEIAEARGLDPLENFLDLLGEDRELDFRAFGEEPTEGHPFQTARLRNVAQLVAEQSGWGRSLPQGHGQGFAAHRSFHSYVATVVEVVVDPDGGWRVPQTHVAIDLGQYVNADRVKTQMEGSVVFGLSLARSSEITATAGRIEQGNFNDYRVLRMDMAPETRVHLVDSSELPAGAGEPGVPPLAPALVNAIYAATGKRFRELPLGNRLEL